MKALGEIKICKFKCEQKTAYRRPLNLSTDSITLANPRVSKTHRHTDACPRKIFFNLRKTLTLECKTGKAGTFSYFW